MREYNIVDFKESAIRMTAEEILKTGETKNTYHTKGENGMAGTVERTEYQKREEISLKFGKGLTENFTSKDGREFTRIKIPNRDPADKTPWASFVLPVKAVHENQFGKGLWAKIPAEGKTLVTRSQAVQQEDGTWKWQTLRMEIPNNELKSRVEAYRARPGQSREEETRPSVREKLSAAESRTGFSALADKDLPPFLQEAMRGKAPDTGKEGKTAGSDRKAEEKLAVKETGKETGAEKKPKAKRKETER